MPRRLETIHPVLTRGNPAGRLRARLSHGALSQLSTLQYVDASNRYVWTPIDGGLYWVRWKLTLLASGFWTRSGTRVFRAIDAVNGDDVGITYSGSWSSLLSVGTALGGNYKNAKNVAAYAEWTVTGAERIYIAYEKRTNGGYMKVLLDGAPATGPDLIDVSGDMCLDCYGASTQPNLWGCVAQDLDPTATYTVRIYPQGTTSGGSDVYIHFEGYGVPCSAFTDANGTVTNDNKEVVYLEDADNGYAYQYTPTGASGAEFTGSDHQNEAISAVTWKDGAGADISVSAGTPTNDAAAVVLNQTGTARHSETGATDHAAIDATLTFSYAGCRQDVEHVWASDATLGNVYVGMSVGRSTVTKGHVAGDGSTVYTLTANDDSLSGQIASKLALLWDASHDFVLQAYLIDPASVNHWQESTNYLHIQDKASGSNKIYIERTTSSSITAPATWQASYLYAVSFYPSFAL